MGKKTIIMVPKKICRACEFNDYRRCGTDYCVRAKCKYKVKFFESKDINGNELS